MRFSKYFLKTEKLVADDDTSVSARLLKQGGFIKESVAGRYYFLPLGQRVQQKIQAIVKEELDKVGCQEMVAPILHPLELWKETSRTNTAGFELMKVVDRRGGEFALGGTAEEMFVDLIRKYKLSYRDLPLNLYQFSPKFRDEIRARGGLLRVREFIMKDAYSFDTDEETFKAEYEKMRGVYTRIFDRLGLPTAVVEADNGYIGGEYCHEFIVEAEAGESRYFTTHSGTVAVHEDVARFERNPANLGAEMLPIHTIDQPDWVRDMNENEKHYGKTKNHFLKNVVFKNSATGRIIIATLTGDLEVNKTKLEQVTGMVGQLESASDEDLASIGTKSGYVHSWGHSGVLTVADSVLLEARNLIGGQKEGSTDTINVNYDRDFTCDVVGDIAMAGEGSIAPNGESYLERRGIEVGNIFQLGYHYSSMMKGAVFTDADGVEKPYYMGCYGIGIGRTMASIVEKYADERGIVWPAQVAPFRVYLIGLQGVEQATESVYKELVLSGIDVIFDDRDKTAGEKFADADLIGVPVRIVVSKKTLDQGGVEFKERGGTETRIVELARVVGACLDKM